MSTARFIVGDTRQVVAGLPDLDARNADLARERIGMFLDVTEGVQQ